MTQALHTNNKILPSNRVRVLIVSDAAPHRNGVGAYYADLVDDLKSHVDEIKMLSPEIIDNKWVGGWMLPLPGDNTQKLCLPNAFELQKAIREFRPSVIVIPTPGMFGLTGAMLAKKNGIPVIIGFHTWFEKLAGLYWNRLQGGLTRTYFELVNKALFRLSEQTLANSQEMVDIAVSNAAPKVGLMGTPLAQNLLTQPLKPIPKKVSKVLFIGRIAAEKNIHSLIEAAKELPTISFTVAGDGPEREAITESIKGLANVKMTGWVGRRDICQLIDQHDVLVLPSKVESFGTVALEAMVRQRLVLVTKACGIVEWPGLRKGLTVINAGSQLAQAIQVSAELSEFELYRRCLIARQCALEHIRWNRLQWLQYLAPIHANADKSLTSKATAGSGVLKVLP